MPLLDGNLFSKAPRVLAVDFMAMITPILFVWSVAAIRAAAMAIHEATQLHSVHAYLGLYQL